jgi:hypothetical protein
VAPAREVNADGSLGASALGWCRPKPSGLPTCIPIGSKRMTKFTYKTNGVWEFRHDTLGLSPGVHRYRVFLNDGTSLDYLLRIAPS